MNDRSGIDSAVGEGTHKILWVPLITPTPGRIKPAARSRLEAACPRPGAAYHGNTEQTMGNGFALPILSSSPATPGRLARFGSAISRLTAVDRWMDARPRIHPVC